MREESIARVGVASHPPCLIEGWDKKYFAVVIGDVLLGTAILRMLVTMAQSEMNECFIILITESKSGTEYKEYPLLKTSTLILPKREETAWLRTYLQENREEMDQVFLCCEDPQKNKQFETMVRECSEAKVIDLMCEESRRTGLLGACELGIIEQLGEQIYYDYASSHECSTAFEELCEFEKEANYNSAMHICTKLSLLGLQIRCSDRISQNAEVTEQELLQSLNRIQIERLARMEHLRWCAFHLVYGYEPLSELEATELLHDKKNRRHICLVPWEELEELSLRYHKDFKKEDRDRVEHIFRYVRQSGHVINRITPEPLKVDVRKKEVSGYPRK